MPVSQSELNTNEHLGKQLFLEYPWFYDNIFARIKNTINEFFQKEYDIRFMGVSYDEENVLFFGDEYFVNKISINKTASAIIRISSYLISSLLDNSLGLSNYKFSINELTDVEAMLIKSFTLFLYNKLDGLFIKQEQNKKILKNSKIYNFTFYVKLKEKHLGKIIISTPDYTLNDNIEFDYREDCFDISSFEDISAPVVIKAGATRISLNDIKNIENGDIIMLEDSNVNKMALLWEGNLLDFSITPNPALIISVDNTGENDVSDNLDKENMWDTILVDVSAEFDNFKLTLGELKQISEGLVIDIGSVYNSKVKLRVAKQVVASGELVILNDRYGVRIDNVKNNNDSNVEYEEIDDIDEDEDETRKAVPPPKQADTQQQGGKNVNPNAKPVVNNGEAQNGDENFNYSDFEIEDESI